MIRRSAVRVLGEVVLIVVACVVDLSVSVDGPLIIRGTAVVLPDAVLVVAVVLVFASLAWRRRRPVAVFGTQIAFALTGAVFASFEPFAGVLIGLYTVSRQCSTRTSVVALLACAVPFGVNSVNAATRSGGDAGAVMQSFALWALLATAVWGFGRLMRRSELAATEALARQAAEASLLAQAERLTLARELHDSVANSVSGMVLQAAGAATLLHGGHGASRSSDGTPGIERVEASLRAIEGAGARAITELHHLLGLLRDPSVADTTGTAGLSDSDDIPGLVEYFRAAGLRVELVVVGEHLDADRLELGPTLYRVTQEALSNSSKYAGRTADVVCRLEWQADHVVLSIRDTCVPDAARAVPVSRALLSSGHGLRGMTERIHLLGGELEAGPVQDGFAITARIPTTTAAATRTIAYHETLR